MKVFNLREQVKKCTNENTIPLIQSIEINKGKSFILPKHNKINRLHADSKRKSVTSSNQIEGIKISSVREKEILEKNLTPKTKEEYLIQGYNKALENVLNVYKYQSLTESYILDLHYMMYESITPEFGGKYKTEQNYIREFDNKGRLIRTIFTPSDPINTPNEISNLIYQYNECIKDSTCNRLILISSFILDFLCIHPFSDGNGRISRLLSTFLLLKNGYDVDLYFPLSYLILKNIDRYYGSLEKSSNGWHENRNDYEYFVHYMLEIIEKGYRKLSFITEVNNINENAIDVVLYVINSSKEPITKMEIKEIAFSLTETTIEKALSDLVHLNKIQIVQKGKYAKYYKI